MAGLAAERRTDEELQALRDAHARFEAVIDDVDKAASADVEFHGLIAQATQNDLFSVLLASLGDALVEIRRETLASGSGSETIEAHLHILDSIASGDAAGAREAMRDHLLIVERFWARSREED